MPRSRRLLQAVETAVQPFSYLTRYLTAALRKSLENIFQTRLDERLVIEKTQIQTQLARDTAAPNRRKRDAADVGATFSKKAIPSCCLKPRATSLAFARTTSPCAWIVQRNTHFADMTFSPPGGYVAPKVLASASPRRSLSIACLQMTEYSSAPDSAYVFDVESSNQQYQVPGLFRSRFFVIRATAVAKTLGIRTWTYYTSIVPHERVVSPSITSRRRRAFLFPTHYSGHHRGNS